MASTQEPGAGRGRGGLGVVVGSLGLHSLLLNTPTLLLMPFKANEELVTEQGVNPGKRT